MPTSFIRSACALATAALVLAAGSGRVAIAQTTQTRTLEGAAALLEQGKVVEARDILLSLRKSATSAEDRARMLDLLNKADRRLQSMSETEVSLQKAELALAQGNLRLADTHAEAVRKSDRASAEQRLKASEILDASALLRDELAPLIPAALDQAVADFNNGRYAEAKAGLASVRNSGVRLSQQQSSTLNRYVDRIYQLERQKGTVFELDYVPLSVIRGASAATGAAVSGQVGRPGEDDPPRPGRGTPRPAPEPSDASAEAPETPEAGDATIEQLPQDETASGAEAAPQDAPAEQPAPAAEPQEPASQDDLFEQAAKFDAQRILAEANAAFDAGRLSEAVEKYTQATTFMARYLTAEELEQAEDRLAEANARLGSQGGGVMGDELDRRRVMIEEAEVVTDNLLKQAGTALEAGDIDGARNAAAEARLRWRTAYNNGLFSEEQYLARNNAIDAMFTRIEQTAEQILAAEIAERGAQLEKDKAEAEIRARTDRENKINESINRLRALMQEQKYEDALRVTEEILFLDPTNPAGLLMRDTLKDVLIYVEAERIKRDGAYAWAVERNEIQEGTIIPDAIVSYPTDWPEMSFRRGEVQSFVEHEVDRRTVAKIESTRIPATFSNASLVDALDFVAKVANVNIDVDWDSLANINIEKDSEVSLELGEIPARVVLDRILEKVSPDEFNRAGWTVQDGIVVVASDQDLRKNTFIVIYDVRDLLFQIPDYDSVPELDLESVLQQGQRGGGGGGGGQGGSIFEDDEETTPGGLTEQELLERLLEIIQTHVDPEGWRELGGDTGIIQDLNGNLIIRNTAQNHREIQGLLNQLREIRNLQITVETRFLVVSTEWFERIGFDLDVYFNAQNNQVEDAKNILEAFGAGSLAGEGVNIRPVDLVGSSDNTVASAGDYLVTAVDPATGAVTYDFQSIPLPVTPPDPLSVIPVQSGSDALTQTLLAGSDFAGQVLATNPAIGIAGQFLDDIQVDFLVEATQADRRSVQLTAPRLTFSNGRAANIYVANQQSFVSDLTPVVGTSAVAFDPTIATANGGFTLVVRGVISADRRYVTMAIQASFAEVVDFGESPVFATVGGETQDVVQSPTNVQLPIVDVTRVQTGVTVPDQGTILLGGQRITTEVEVETGVPVLSKIPIINRFFTNRANVSEERTLLVLVKPTIIIQNEEEEKNFPGLLDALQNPYGSY